MSRWDKFKAKHKEVMVNGESLKVYPLKVRDIEKLDGMRKATNKAKAIAEVIKLSLRDDVELTMEEILEFDIPIEETIMEAVVEVNGQNVEKLKSAAKGLESSETQ